MSTRSRHRHGFLEAYDPSTNEPVGVWAPVVIWHDFNGPALDNTNDFNVTAVNSGTAAVVDGWMTLTTGDANDDNVEVCSDLVFKANVVAVAECKLRNDDVSGQGFFFGFTDAITEGADSLPIDYSNSGALQTDASDAVGFTQDPDNSAVDGTSIMCVAVAGDTDRTAVDSGSDLADTTKVTLRVEIDSVGVARFYVNGASVGSIGTAAAPAVTITDPLCVYIGSINREGAVNTLDVDYIKAWGGRP